MRKSSLRLLLLGVFGFGTVVFGRNGVVKPPPDAYGD